MSYKNKVAVALLTMPLISFGGTPDEKVSDDAIERYANIVWQSYGETLELAKIMDQAVDTFLEMPSEKTLDAAKNAWTQARLVYGQTEAYRFYDGPIDGPEGLEGQINAWPMDEAYVDYVEGNDEAGIINKPELYPNISKELIISLNEEGGEANIATGYHAIEFLLWGQDLDANGPGKRSYKDYVIAKGAKNVERRRHYLAMASDLLVSDLNSVVTQWNPHTGDYVKAFLADRNIESLKKMWTGIVFMASDELSSERMFVAYDTQDQEDEQSCFSDTTYNDVLANAQGILNVYYGTWGGTRGLGLHEVLLSVDKGLAARVDAQLKVAMDAVKAIPQPFDSVISAEENSLERALLMTAIMELQTAGSLLQEGAAAMGITINL